MTTFHKLTIKHLRQVTKKTLGPGRYEHLICTGCVDGYPVLTFTSPSGVPSEVHPPAVAYLAMLIAGLKEAHDLKENELVAYLGSTPGCTRALVTKTLATL